MLSNACSLERLLKQKFGGYEGAVAQSVDRATPGEEDWSWVRIPL